MRTPTRTPTRTPSAPSAAPVRIALVLLAAAFGAGLSTQAEAAATRTFVAVADAQLSTQAPNSPNGTDTKMAVCGGGTPVCSTDGVNEKRAVVKFIVSDVTTTITSARLRFYVGTKPVPALQVRQMTTTGWTEASATWNNTAGSGTTAATYASPSGTGVGWYEADVTEAVTGNGPVSFMIANPTASTTRLSTRESANQPQLLLTTADAPPDPEPPAPEEMSTFLGTTHAHTGAFNNHGVDSSTAADVFATAKSSGYHFLILTEHSGPTGPADGAAFYADARAQAAAYSEVGRFVGLAGYEYSENSQDGDSDIGHMTGWGTDAYINASAPGVDFDEFYDRLVAERATKPVFAGFNHPLAPGHNASTSALLTPERRDLLVMSETSNSVGATAAEEAGYYSAFVAELDRGWRVAPSCGLDSHGLTSVRQGETRTKKPCRAGVLAPSLTRADLLEAFRQRRMYSTREINLDLRYSVNGSWMGSQVGTPATARLDIGASDPDTGVAADKITKIDVVGSGGVVLASQSFDAHSVTWQPTIPVGSNAYLFVRVYNGDRSAHTAIAAPVWFE